MPAMPWRLARHCTPAKVRILAATLRPWRNSTLNLRHNLDLVNYRRVEVDLQLRCLDCNQETVPRSLVVPFKMWAFPPPSAPTHGIT